MGTTSGALLRRCFADAHHLNRKCEGFAGQGVVQVKNYGFIINTIDPGRDLLAVRIGQGQDLAHLGFHPRWNIGMGTKPAKSRKLTYL
jgi:hypothetical protein